MGNFKNLRVWQDGLNLAIEIYSITRSGNFATDFGLKNQIQRAGVSISSNISEGMKEIPIKKQYIFSILQRVQQRK